MDRPDEVSRQPATPPSVLDRFERRAGGLSRVRLTEPREEPGGTAAAPAALRHLGRYALSGEIARGGMGVVLRGRDADLGREVALKVLREELSERADVLQRFVEEAQIGGQLQHPGIVPVYELGSMADERPYFTMKLVEGRTLADLLRERPTPLDGLRRLLDVFEAVCQTMAYAHARGVVHRDLKPANVMVGAFGEVQVVDWGLAKVLGAKSGRGAKPLLVDAQEDEPDSDPRSRSGSVYGTPAYMPPEQARGEIDALDERADVFSLGALLCELLTGSPPYDGKRESTLAQAAQAKLDDAHARLEACAADPELVALARECMAPSIESRPRSARAVAERMRAHLDSVEERARAAQIEAAEARVRAAEERKARHLTLALSATIVLALVAAGGGFAWFERQRADRARRVALEVQVELDRANLARGEARFADALAAAERADAIARSSEPDAALRARVSELLAHVREQDERARRAAALEADNAALFAALADLRQPERASGLYASDWSAVERDTRALFERHGIDVDAGEPSAAAALLATRGADVRLAVALDAWAQVRAAAGDDAGRERLHAVADRLDPDPRRVELRAAIAGGEPERLDALARSAELGAWPPESLSLLGSALTHGKRYATAIDVLERAVERAPADFAVRMNLARALTLADVDRQREAAREFAAAMALRPESIEALHELVQVLDLDPNERAAMRALLRRAIERRPDDAHLLDHLGRSLLEDDASPEEATERIALLERARELAPEDVLVLTDVGLAYLLAGRRDEAMEAFEQAARSDPANPAPRNRLGTLFEELGRRADAVDAYREAARLDPTDPVPWGHLARVCLALGRFEDALDAIDHGLAIAPDDFRLHGNRAAALGWSGRNEEALADFERASELAPDDFQAHYNLATHLLRLGRTEEAIPHLERALELAPDFPQARINYGFALRRLGRDAEAIFAFRRGLERMPEQLGARVTLAELLEKTGERATAIEEYERVLERDPEHLDALKDLCRLFATTEDEALRDPDRAAELGERAVELAPRDGDAWNALGIARYRADDVEGALEAFDRSMELREGGDATDWLFAAMARHRTGEAAKARELLDRAVERMNGEGARDPRLEAFRREADALLGPR